MLAAAHRSITRLLRSAGVATCNQRLLVMCSGGIDSVAAAHLMASLPAGHTPRTVDLVWCDHGLRDTRIDEQVARNTAHAIDAHLHLLRAHEGQIASHAQERQSGLQAAAREWRYGKVARLACIHDYDLVVTGHTASDQIETALHGMLTSGGTAACAGMRAVRDVHGVRLLRPLLALTRTRIEDVVAELGVQWVDDPSNSSRTYRRNMLRHDVLPLLEEAYPGASLAIERSCHLSASHAATETGLARACRDAFATGECDGTPTLDVARLAELPSSARCAVIAVWLRDAGAGRSLSTRIITAIDQLVTGANPHGEVAVGRACVRRERYHLSFTTSISPPEDPA